MASKVLVIDDEEDYRLILKDYLTAEGYEVRLAVDGREGLARAAEFLPDIILVDWSMPNMDGQDFVRSLRRTSGLRGIPVLMLTARAAAADELEALHFGSDEYVTKPFSAEDLLARVRALLRRSHAAT